MLKIPMHRIVAVAAACAALAVLAGACSQESGLALDDLYGDGYRDKSEVLCTVGDLDITRQMMELRLSQMPNDLKQRFTGQDWEKRFLNFMVNEALVVKAGLDNGVDKIPEVSAQIIAQRRYIVFEAAKMNVLFKDVEPSEAQLRFYYDDNPNEFVNLGMIQARHVECEDQATADKAYEELKGGMPFPYAVGYYSVNEESKKLNGDLGWFNKGGFIGALPYGKEFSEHIWDWSIGLHEPFLFEGRWHVVEVLRRKESRRLPFAEVKDQIVARVRPHVEEDAMRLFLDDAWETQPITFHGKFAPGQGRDVENLFRRALAAQDPQAKMDWYQLIVQDFPDTEHGAKALFMMANLQLDEFHSPSMAAKLFRRLVLNYPNSDLVDQAQYMLDNMDKPGFVTPESLEDLRGASE